MAIIAKLLSPEHPRKWIGMALLAQQSKTWLWINSVSLSVLVGLIDYLTGYELSVVLFYSLPILLMVWFGDRISAVFIALLCAIVWWWADEASGHPYSQIWIQIWETSVRLGYFLLFVVGGSAVKSRIELLEHSRQLEQEIIRISEREQRRIGQDLHDGLCQYFAAVGFAAGKLKGQLEKQGAPGAQAAAEIEDLIMKGVAQTRGLARGLAPVENEEGGLQFALESLALSTSHLQGIDCRLICETPVPIFENSRANHLYRIAQEAINNATRHGGAKHIILRLSSEGDRVRLAVEDDGSGISEPLPENHGMGLSTMRYRARLVGGHLEVAGRAGGGTVIACAFLQTAPASVNHSS